MNNAPSKRIQVLLIALAELRDEYRTLARHRSTVVKRLADVTELVRVEADKERQPLSERLALLDTLADLQGFLAQENAHNYANLRRKLSVIKVESKKRTR